MIETEPGEVLRHVSDEGLLRAFAALTHRMHAAGRGGQGLRAQRDRVQAEILERMRCEGEPRGEDTPR